VVPVPKFSEAVDLLQRELESDTSIKPESKHYRQRCLRKIERSWPGLWDLRLDTITPLACKDWAPKLSKEIACVCFNNTIGTLKQVLVVGNKAHKATSGAVLENPAVELKRVRVKPKD
jgi:hypothetical protein